MFKKLNKKGFTLAELLVVVAIIGVLVAISIPIFTSQLEKSREAVDAANIRAAYAEMMSDALTGTYGKKDDGKEKTYTVTLKQEKAGWQSTFDFPADLSGAQGTANTIPYAKGKATLTWSEADGAKVEYTATK